MHSTKPAVRRLLTALAGLACAVVVSGSAPPRGDLMVVATYLPQCAYGLGYEQPMHAELRTNGQVVAMAETAGTFTGPGSLSLSFYASDVPEGNYRLHLGRCPGLRSDPKGAVACDPIEWFKELDLNTRIIQILKMDGRSPKRVFTKQPLISTMVIHSRNIPFIKFP